MAILRSTNIEPSTGTTLALGASGDSIAVSSDSIKANTWQDLGGNNLFVSNGSGTLSNVNSGFGGGGYTLISTTTASTVASVAITAGITSTYDEYMFVLTDFNPATDSTRLSFQCSLDGGSNYNVVQTTTAWYAYNSRDGGTNGLSYVTGTDQAQGTNYQAIGNLQGNTAGRCTVAILNLFNPSSTTYVKHWNSRSGTHGDGSAGIITDYYFAGYFNTTTALNAISFKFESGNITNGVIQMYGVS